MLLTSKKTPIIEKTQELCRTIVEQDAFKELGEKIKNFENNDEARGQYESLVEKQTNLQEKQHRGEALTEQEINEFESSREAFMQNPIAKDFMDAQQAIHKVIQTVSEYVSKTFELGRTPTDDDFESGSCGPKCGCSGG